MKKPKILNLYYILTFILFIFLFFVNYYNMILFLIIMNIIIYSVNSIIIQIKINKELKNKRFFDVILYHSNRECSSELLSFEHVSKINYNIYDNTPKIIKKLFQENYGIFYKIILDKLNTEFNLFKEFILILNKPFDEKYEFPEGTIYYKGYPIDVPILKHREFMIIDKTENNIPIIVDITPKEYTNERNNGLLEFRKKYVKKYKELKEEKEILEKEGRLKL